MKKKIHRLNVSSRPELCIIGISSHENDYRLSWAINNHLGFKFSRTENLKYHNDKIQETQTFSVFSHIEEDYELKYYLVSNTGQNGFLLPEYRNVDFLFLIYGEVTENELNDILGRMKQMEIINLAFQISDLSSKSIEKLVFC
ncbi:MAG: IPExxxVDY family protein [Bacteroidales bacterium]|nr:IPExxxVDY family protein [Bacteroidales bacterium]